MSVITDVIRMWLSDIHWFSWLVVRRRLRAYQKAPVRAIVESAIRRQGREFAVLFPRQAGKNEMQAQMIAYLLNLYQRTAGAQIVHASPTFKPQALNAMRRLEETLNNAWNRGRWRKHDGYIVQLGQALCLFLSADPSANVVGATASVLLVVDEAQHVQESLFQERFAPMAASSNATIAYFGTAWSSRTLLAGAMRQLRAQEAADGVQRVFVVTPEQVAAENPAYGEFVRRQVARLGRNHPLVKTQFFNETIDAEGGMFPPERRTLMQGAHARRHEPAASRLYALLLDVAGEDEAAFGEIPNFKLQSSKRDSTALTVVEVDPATLADPLIKAPTYRAVDRREWVGVKHTRLYGEIVALARHWRARYLVADATGVGAGLAAFLAAALGREVVIPFEFSRVSKSQLGWDFLAVVDTGRWKEWGSEVRSERLEVRGPQSHLSPPTSHVQSAIQARFWQQLAFCQYETLPGPSKLMRWAVPDGTRDPATGELVHDDLVVSAALCAVLDDRDWTTASPALIVPAPDPLAGQERQY